MTQNVIPKRSLVDITLEEATEVLKLGEGFYDSEAYQLRVKANIGESTQFAQLYYTRDGQEHIAVNFSDTPNAVSLCKGNHYFRTHHRISTYLSQQGFDLTCADK